MKPHDQIVDLLRGAELTRYPELKTAVGHPDRTAGDILVFIGNDRLQSGNRKSVIGQFLRKGFDPDFPLQPSGDIDFQHTRDGFDVFFQIFGNLLESHQVDIAG